MRCHSPPRLFLLGTATIAVAMLLFLVGLGNPLTASAATITTLTTSAATSVEGNAAPRLAAGGSSGVIGDDTTTTMALTAGASSVEVDGTAAHALAAGSGDLGYETTANLTGLTSGTNAATLEGVAINSPSMTTTRLVATAVALTTLSLFGLAWYYHIRTRRLSGWLMKLLRGARWLRTGGVSFAKCPGSSLCATGA